MRGALSENGLTLSDLDPPMNPYQKAAILLVRISGFQVLFMGSIGAIYFLFARAIGIPVKNFTPEEWGACFLWSASGILAIAFSRPIGRLFANDLD